MVCMSLHPPPTETLLEDTDGCGSLCCALFLLTCALLMTSLHSKVLRNRNMSPEEAHLIESKSIYWVARQGDSKEGIQSFLEKRAPAYPMDSFADAPEWFPWWREISTQSKL